ncbi:MAG TPA: DUF4190 domain-containing protein [Pseudolysinimonas sp.]|nr:DUF4190 domain-containing protein [Pseudolysinimonas sp.]
MSDIHSPEPAAPEPQAPAPAAAAPTATTPAAPEPQASSATPPPAPPTSGLAVAALVVGIVAAVFAIIPGPSFGAFVPAILAAVLGIVALARTTPRRGFALAGVILGAVSLLLAIIVSIVAIVAGAGLASHTSALDGGAGSAAGSGAGSSSSSAAAKPTPTTTPTATVAPVPADVVLSGHGDAVITASALDGADEPGVATFTHDGSSNFAVWSLDANANQLDLLVNMIGPYSGTVLFDKQSTQHTESLQITADGNWTVTLHSLRALRSFDATGTTGHGDDVLIYRGNAGAATLTHDGSSNFAVWTYGDQTTLVVNEIGAYNGTVRWTKGPELVTVTADGTWSIALH